MTLTANYPINFFSPSLYLQMQNTGNCTFLCNSFLQSYVVVHIIKSTAVLCDLIALWTLVWTLAYGDSTQHSEPVCKTPPRSR